MDESNKNQNMPNSLAVRSSQYVFKDGYYDFICKKTEKLASAVYVITGHIKDNDPIKLAHRDIAIDLIFIVSSLNGSLSQNPENLIRKLRVSISKITSLLTVAFNSGLISEANYLILKREFSDLMGEAERVSSNNQSIDHAPIPGAFFDVPRPKFKEHTEVEGVEARPVIKDKKVTKKEPVYKRQKNYVEISQQGNINLIKDKNLHLSPNEKKTERRESIISILHKNQGIDIKGFSKEMTGCSEKTIQRELIDMLDEGLIRKEGERRWSRYYLK